MLSWLKTDKVDHPLADAKQAQQVIAAFPADDPWQTLEDASHWLESINTTAGFKLDKRFELMDALDSATRRSQRMLLDTFTALKADDRIRGNRIWNTVTHFWKLLAGGYLACVVQAQGNKNINSAFKVRLPVIAARGTRALRNQIKWVLMRYGMAQPEIWAGIAHHALFAEAGGFADTMVEVYPAEHSSVRHEFLRIMMFSVASPGGLSPADQDVAERIIAHLAPQFAFATKPSGSGDFCFDLEGPQAPLRLMRDTRIATNARFFNAAEALKTAQAMLTMVTGAGEMPSGLELGAGVNVITAGRVLKYLLCHWANEVPPRASERRKTAMTLQVVHGYQKVLVAVAPELDEGLDFIGATAHETWIAENVSAGGYGLIAPPGMGQWLKVGILVGVRTEKESSWSIGVVRRVKCDEHQQFRIGVQLIARTPLQVSLRAAAAGERGAMAQNALLLSTRQFPHGSLQIIARTDTCSENRLLEGVYGKPEVSVTLDAASIVESGDDFDWLRYRLIESVM